jgi:hypothetical protein
MEALEYPEKLGMEKQIGCGPTIGCYPPQFGYLKSGVTRMEYGVVCTSFTALSSDGPFLGDFSCIAIP